MTSVDITPSKWFDIRESTRSFYDGYRVQLLHDFVSGNKRVESAIRYAISMLPHDVERVLDIGCGIGWSSYEISRSVRGEVVGLDLSEALVEVAQVLFSSTSVRFTARDVCDDWEQAGSFDAAILIDVYEHIPEEERQHFHERIGRALKSTARVILTCPTPRHQQRLREECPEGLQPVDEDITREVLSEFAATIGGVLSDFRTVTVWNDEDYLHATISRGAVATATDPVGKLTLSSASERQDIVASKLGLFPLNRRVLLSRCGDRRVVVAAGSFREYSESFIRAHAQHLPAQVHVLQGSRLSSDGSGRPLVRGRLWRKLAYRGGRYGHRFAEFERVQAVARYLRQQRIEAVLAEYGLNGLHMLEPCARAGVPLVVHFHGYDAHKKSVLSEHEASYRRMFDQAAGIVVVSRKMHARIEALGCDPAKLHLVPYGIDLSQFRQTDPGKNPPQLLAVGRFVEKKAPYLTLLAFARIAERFPDAALTMCGRGQYHEACREMAAALGLADRVAFPGAVDHAEVARLMQQSRAFVQHSVEPESGDCEGTPVAILEAGASGLPVISTRHTGICEAVRDGETGFLVEERDVAGMAERMAAVLEDAALATRLGQAARQHIAANYESSQQIGKLWNVIESAIATNRNGHA